MTTVSRQHLYIGGEWRAPATDHTMEVVSPHTEEVVGVVPEASNADVDAAVAAARASFDGGAWSDLDPAERIGRLRKLETAYAKRADELSELITLEMGSPLLVTKAAQIPMAQMALTAMLEVGLAYPWEETRRGYSGQDFTIRREGVGVVAGIGPWNAPQFTLMAKLAPALVAGCSIVLKPAPQTPLDALLLAEVLDEADLPPGVVSILPGGADVGHYLVGHPGVDKVAFTGSTAAGRAIGRVCGEQLKRVSLELGGKSAAIVLDDADLDVLAAGLKFASMANSGQFCAAQTRILAPRRTYDAVVESLATMASGLRLGDPDEPATELGPLVSERQRDRVRDYIAKGQAEGATLATGGGGRPADLERGWYVQPTVFADVTNDMTIAREEIFGPVLSVIPYDDDASAVRIANDSTYGLAGSVWTSDVERGYDIARRVRTGTFGINQYAFDFNCPFGGYKASGLGRELGREGLDSYVELKSIAPPPEPR